MKWHSTKYKGVRYREHETRKHGVKKDRYLAIRYQKDGKRVEEGIGWTSERDPEDAQFWTEAKAALVLERLKGAAKHGTTEAPTRLAEKREIEKQRKAAEQAEQERRAKDLITFGEFFIDTYLPQSEADKKPLTAKRESGFFNNWFKPIIGGLPLKSISAFHLERLKKEMADKGQSSRSIQYALAITRQVFNTAKRLGAFDGEPPTAKVKKPKVDNGRMRFLTHEEATSLLEALAKKSQDVHDMTLLSLHCGLRFGEIASLTRQDVDLEKGILTIRDAKAGSRYAFLTDQATEMLKNRSQGNPADYVFPKRVDKKHPDKNQKMTKISHTFFRTVNELGMNNGIDDPRLQVCFHTCRHSYASWLIEEGADLYVVQKLLGHKTNVMTQRYSHLSENKLRGAAQALSIALQKHDESAQPGQVVNFSKEA
jgi:integrase